MTSTPVSPILCNLFASERPSSLGDGDCQLSYCWPGTALMPVVAEPGTSIQFRLLSVPPLTAYLKPPMSLEALSEELTNPRLQLSQITGPLLLQCAKTSRQAWHLGHWNSEELCWDFPHFDVMQAEKQTFTFRITIKAQGHRTFTVDPEMYVGVGGGR